MKVLSLALLGVCGWIGSAPAAQADDDPTGVGVDVRGGRMRGGAVGPDGEAVKRADRGPHGPGIPDPIRTRPARGVEPYRPHDPVPHDPVIVGPVRTRPPRGIEPYRPYDPVIYPPIRTRPPREVEPYRPFDPVIVTDPGFPAHPGYGQDHGQDDGYACACERRHLPPRMVARQETVCVPAVYDDRCVPVYETRCVPVYEERRVPVYETVRKPILEWVVDPRTGRRHQVVVGERKERVQVGERTERVQVGERTEQVQVGERHERVLVQPETTRVVTRYETVPGRWVTICEGRHHGGHEGEVLTSEAYGREMASADREPGRHFGSDPEGRDTDRRERDDDKWYPGGRR